MKNEQLRRHRMIGALKLKCLASNRGASFCTYEDLACITGVQPHEMGPDLDWLTRQNLSQGKPPLTALVVLKATGVPGAGYWGDVTPDYDAWIADLTRLGVETIPLATLKTILRETAPRKKDT
jgi:hypothetical protein